MAGLSNSMAEFDNRRTVTRKLANNASSERSVGLPTDRVHAVVVLQKIAGLVLGSNLVYSGWEFSLQLDNQSITTINRMFISSTDMYHNGHMGSTVLVSAFHIGV